MKFEIPWSRWSGQIDTKETFLKSVPICQFRRQIVSFVWQGILPAWYQSQIVIWSWNLRFYIPSKIVCFVWKLIRFKTNFKSFEQVLFQRFQYWIKFISIKYSIRTYATTALVSTTWMPFPNYFISHICVKRFIVNILLQVYLHYPNVDLQIMPTTVKL